jgi:hypothetical protein
VAREPQFGTPVIYAFSLQNLLLDYPPANFTQTSSCRLLNPNRIFLRWDASNHLADKAVSAFYGILRLTVFIRAGTGLYPDSVECSPHHQTIN